MYTCLAIDDEFSALEIINDYIALRPELKLLKSYSNASTALLEIENLKKQVDIIFLDIEMPVINGLELAKLIRHKTKKLVFTTAHSGYAVDSYELEADAFLLKPFSPLKFNQTIQRLFSGATQNQEKKPEEFILLKSAKQRNQYTKIRLDKIFAVEAQERLIKIYLMNEVLLAKSSFSNALAILTTKGFAQVHRSFMIAENQIKTFERSYVILNNNIKITIGRKYADFYYKLSKKDQNFP